MDEHDRVTMSNSFESDPWACDASCLTWCNRPRLYWMDLEIIEDEFTTMETSRHGVRSLVFKGCQPLEEVLRAGWTKVDEQAAFPTFTTARPSAVPGRKPAGIKHCTLRELHRWELDRHRFPPYQYKTQHCVQNSRGEHRLVDVCERECMMGFPVNYTQNCCVKAVRGTQHWEDTRLTLVGNSWSVPIVSCLLQQLFVRLGLSEPLSPQALVEKCTPGGMNSLQGKLFRLPLNPDRSKVEDKSTELACRMGNLISVKGEDIMLTTPQEQLHKFQRLRSTVPAKMWKWKDESHSHIPQMAHCPQETSRCTFSALDR